jgi:hypothetical protein
MGLGAQRRRRTTMTDKTEALNRLLKEAEASMLIGKSEGFLQFMKPYEEGEIQFKFGKTEEDKLKSVLIQVQDRIQNILKRLGDRTSHLRIIGE